MYRVTNKFGNVQYTVETERERDYYLKNGYIEVPIKKELPKKEGAKKNGTRKGKNNTERDI